MTASLTACKTITIGLFRGDRRRPVAAALAAQLEDEKHSLGPGPTLDDLLIFTGHAGLSMDGGTTFYGFHAGPTGLPTWKLLDELKRGRAFPGVVRDDSQSFHAARQHHLNVLRLDIIVPESAYDAYRQKLDEERQGSKYSYGFPSGDGDCNCITWLERLGIPLLTGRMDECFRLAAVSALPTRRFGQCV